MLYGLFVVFAAGLFGAVPLGAYALSLAQRQEGIPLPLAVAFSGVLGVCCLVFFAVSLCCARPGWPRGGKGDRSLPLWGTLAGVLTGIQGLNTAWFAFSCDGLASKLSSLALGLLAAGAGCAFALGQWGKGPRLLAPVLIFPWLAFSLVSLFLPGGRPAHLGNNLPCPGKGEFTGVFRPVFSLPFPLPAQAAEKGCRRSRAVHGLFGIFPVFPPGPGIPVREGTGPAGGKPRAAPVLCPFCL